MGKKRKGLLKMGGGATVFFLVVLFWLVVTHPWLLLFPLAYWFCFSRPNSTETVRRPSPPQPVAPAPAPRFVPPPVKATPPDFIPKDREYNRYLARTWDAEFEALVKVREQVPPS